MTDVLPAPRPVLVAFVVAAVLNLVSVTADVRWLEIVTKPLLCGLLLGWAWLACDRRPPGLTVRSGNRAGDGVRLRAQRYLLLTTRGAG